MYSELFEFVRHISRKGRLLSDGDIWTAFAGGSCAVVWLHCEPKMIPAIQMHLGDLLTLTGIVFGFVLTTLTFYIQSAAAWDTRPPVQKIIGKLIDWHVWTVMCLLALIGYTTILWTFHSTLNSTSWLLPGAYGTLVFIGLYCGFQILNHALTLWWTFHNRTTLGR